MPTETLRPNAAGDETSINFQYPSTGAHWEKVDEVVADDYTTFISATGSAFVRDLYNLPASSGAGAISKITVFFRCFRADSTGGAATASIKAGSTVADGSEESVTLYAWTTYSHEWAKNPDDSKAWEWADIDALQIGVKLKRNTAASMACTHIYVEVEYTESTSSVKAVGVVALAGSKAIGGVPIASVKAVGVVEN